MKSKLLLTTAVLSLALSTGYATAQDRTNDKDKQPTQQQLNDQRQPQRTPSTQTPAASQSQPSTQTQNTPAAGSQPNTSASQPSSAQTNPPASQPSSAQSSQPAPDRPSSAQSAQPSTNQPAAAQSSQPAANQPSSAQTTPPATGNQPSSAQSNQPATTNRPSAAQTAPSTQTQQPATAQQQQQGTTNNVRISASLQAPQRTRLNEAVTRLDVRPVSNVNFSVSIGTAVPASVSVHPLPSTIVEIIPQYRGYSYFVVRDEVVIVEPHSHKIVDVIERRGGAARAESTTSTQRKVNLSAQEREVIRKHRTTRTTTGSATRTRTTVKVGDELPESVEIHTFSDDVYRSVPSVREYRYIESERGTYLVEPRSRRVIEEIDAD